MASVSSAEAISLLDALASHEQQQVVTHIIGQSLLTGIAYDEILLRSGLPRKGLDAALAALLASGEVLQMTREPRLFISLAALENLKKWLINELTTFMAANPLKEGIGKEELKTRLPKRTDQRFFTPLLAALERDALVMPDREIVKPAGLAIPKNISGDGLGARIDDLLQEGGNEPPTVKELIEQLRSSEKSVRDNLALMVRNGAAIRISNDLFYSRPALDGLREKLVDLLREKGEIVPPEYRDITGLSRKFLIPLLEHFDSEKLTIRVGDKRVLRKR